MRGFLRSLQNSFLLIGGFLIVLFGVSRATSPSENSWKNPLGDRGVAEADIPYGQSSYYAQSGYYGQSAYGTYAQSSYYGQPAYYSQSAYYGESAYYEQSAYTAGCSGCSGDSCDSGCGK